jgi:5-methylcytosine-specific restriction endonuclease McrA
MTSSTNAGPGSQASHCYRCGQVKGIDAFIRRVDDRHYRMCRECVSEILQERAAGKKRLVHTATHRTCYLCRRFLPVDEFTKRRNGTFFSGCKECNRHVFSQRRRARLLAAEGSYTVAEWKALLALYEACPKCGRAWDDIPLPPGRKTPITVDHIVAVSKQGPNSIENLQPLCYSCNSRKGDRPASAPPASPC